jgi:hypothetical protein
MFFGFFGSVGSFYAGNFTLIIVNVVVKKGVTATLWHSEACDEFGLAK